jgi:hypothetical protein
MAESLECIEAHEITVARVRQSRIVATTPRQGYSSRARNGSSGLSRVLANGGTATRADGTSH